MKPAIHSEGSFRIAVRGRSRVTPLRSWPRHWFGGTFPPRDVALSAAREALDRARTVTPGREVVLVEYRGFRLVGDAA